MLKIDCQTTSVSHYHTSVAVSFILLRIPETSANFSICFRLLPLFYFQTVKEQQRLDTVPGPATGGSGLWDFFGSSRSFSSCLRVLLCRASLNMGKAWAGETGKTGITHHRTELLSAAHTEPCTSPTAEDPNTRAPVDLRWQRSSRVPLLPRCTLAYLLFHITLHNFVNTTPIKGPQHLNPRGCV